MTSLYIENDSLIPVTVTVNGKDLTTLPSTDDFNLTIHKSDSLVLTNSNGSVNLDGYKIAKDYKGYLTIVDDANGKINGIGISQLLGTNTSSYSNAISPSIFISFTPVYFVELSGKSTGTFTQLNGNKYILKPGTQPSKVSYMKFYIFIIIVFILLAVVSVLGIFAYKKYKKRTPQV